MVRSFRRALRLGPTQVGPSLLLPPSHPVCKRLICHKPQTGAKEWGGGWQPLGTHSIYQHPPSNGRSSIAVLGRCAIRHGPCWPRGCHPSCPPWFPLPRRMAAHRWPSMILEFPASGKQTVAGSLWPFWLQCLNLLDLSGIIPQVLPTHPHLGVSPTGQHPIFVGTPSEGFLSSRCQVPPCIECPPPQSAFGACHYFRPRSKQTYKGDSPTGCCVYSGVPPSTVCTDHSSAICKTCFVCIITNL